MLSEEGSGDQAASEFEEVASEIDMVCVNAEVDAGGVVSTIAVKLDDASDSVLGDEEEGRSVGSVFEGVTMAESVMDAEVEIVSVTTEAI